jgi:DNA-binding IclR family transcriptional regulator
LRGGIVAETSLRSFTLRMRSTCCARHARLGETMKIAERRDDRTTSDDRYRLQMLERAVEVLFSFARDAPQLSLDDMSIRTGINKTSLLRVLRTLEPYGFVVRDEDRYRLGPRVLDLANTYLSTLSFHKIAQPHVEALARVCRQTVSIAVLDAPDIVYVAIEQAQRELGIQGEIGGRHPVHATALGKVLLSALDPEERRSVLESRPLERLTHRTTVDIDELLRAVDRVAREGFALDDEERGIGIRCVAAPIRDFRGRVVAAMSVAGPIFHMGDGAIASIRGHLLDTVRAVSRELGYSEGAWDASA